jgi:hypothetical protein
MDLEKKIAQNFSFISNRWKNLKLAATVMTQKIVGVRIEQVSSAFFYVSSGRLEDVFYLIVSYNGTFFNISFQIENYKLLMIVPFVYTENNLKMPYTNVCGRVVKIYVYPTDISTMSSFFGRNWAVECQPLRCEMSYFHRKEKFIWTRFQTMCAIFPLIAQLFPDVILYNTFPYIICLPNGELIDNFYFDVKNPKKEIQFTVSFEAKSATSLKIVPFVIYKGHKSQMRNPEGNVIKFFIGKTDITALTALFNAFWLS